MKKQRIEIKKNNCINCRYLNEKKAACSIEGNFSPIRSCVVAINKEIVNFISKQGEGRILDVGCGDWSYVKNNLPANWEWRGIDVVEVGKNGKPTVASDIGSVEDIPFENEYFDVVVCNQSIEHWYEFGVSFFEGISEMSRVLKKEGILFLNAPIHLHGHRIFLLNQKEKLLSFFGDDYWKIFKIEEWGRDRYPMEDYFGWRGKLHPKLMKQRPSYVLSLALNKKADFRLSHFRRFSCTLQKFFIKIIPQRLRPVFSMVTYQNPVFIFYYTKAVLKNKISKNKS